MVVEFWVMKVLLHPGPMRRPAKLEHLTAESQARVMVSVEAGSLCCLPDGCIAEPVDVFARQLDADQHREKLASDDRDGDYRVVLNTDAVV